MVPAAMVPSMRRGVRAAVVGVLLASGALASTPALAVAASGAGIAADADARRVDAVVVDTGHGTVEVTSYPQITLDEYRRLRQSATAEQTVSLDTMLQLAETAADPLRADQWHLDAVHAEQAWSAGTAGVTVAVVDTGVVDVDGLVIDASASFVDQTTSPFEHGTQVAATIGAALGNRAGGVGVAPGVHLLSARVCVATLCPTSAVARGIVWAVDRGADVINLSLGGAYSAVIDRAVSYAIARGVSVVAAAGNSSCANASLTCNPDADNVMFPAALEGVIAVTSTGASGRPSAWTSKGRRTSVAAPGEDIWMSGPGLFGTMTSGTSFAAPIVAGAIAEMRAAAPSLSPTEIAASVRLSAVLPADTALPRPGVAREWYYGAGVFDAGRAVATAGRLDGATWAAPAATSRPGAVDLVWTAVPQAVAYDIHVDGRPTLTVAGPTATIVGLVDGQPYGVAVEARTASGPVIGRPTLVTAQVALPAPVITSVHDLADGSGDVAVQLAGVPAGVDMVDARIDGRPVGRVLLPGSVSVPSAVAMVRVPVGGNTVAGRLDLAYVSSVGGRSPSSRATVSASRFLPEPGDVRTTVSDGRIDVAWNAVAGATVYDVDISHIERSTGAPQWVTSSSSTTGTSMTLTGVVNGATYHVSVNSRIVLTGATSSSVDLAAIAVPDAPTPPSSLAVEMIGGAAGSSVRLRFPVTQVGDRYLLSTTTAAPREIVPDTVADGSAATTLTDAAFRFGRGAPVRLCVAVVRMLDSGAYTQYGPWSTGVTFRLGGAASASDGSACADLSTLAAPASPLGPGFSARRPIRMVDTRQSAIVTAGATLVVPVAGIAGIGDDVSAVAANITAVGPAGPGYLTVWPCGQERPLASSVNYGAGEVSANAVFTSLGDGALCVYSSATSHVIVDVTGTFNGSAPSYTPVAPTRVVDSRSGDLGGRLAAGSTVVISLWGHGSVPDGAGAVTINVTGIDAATAGYVTLWPCDNARPATSNLNLAGGSTRPNLVTVGLSVAGEVCLYTQSALDVAVDVAGWWGTGASTAFTSVAPSRVVDSRIGQGITTRLAAGEMVEVSVAGSAGVGADARAVSMNITVVSPKSNGYLTAWPCAERPVVSNVNFAAEQTIPNAAAVALSSHGTVCLYANAATDVVVDVNGFWS